MLPMSEVLDCSSHTSLDLGGRGESSFSVSVAPKYAHTPGKDMSLRSHRAVMFSIQFRV